MSTKHIEDFYPLAPMQQGMVFHSLLNPGSGVYIEQTSCTLRGDLEVESFERAWREVLRRHPILRTGFVGESLKELAQVVHRAPALPLVYEDWRALPTSDRAARAEAYSSDEVGRGFDLARPPLFRLGLFRLADDAYHFVWTYHHALLDGWSTPILLHEVFALYDAYQRGEEPQLPAPRPYRDYIVWLRRQDQQAAERFWRRYLTGFSAPTPIGAPRGDSAVADAYGERELTLSAEASDDLLALARRHGLTMNTLVQGAWALLLARYSGEDDVLFGATVSGRPADLPGAETMVGLFINTLPVRAQIDPETSVAEWLSQLQAQQVELRQYEYTPLVQIQGWSEAPRGQPLFESILVFENYPIAAALREESGSLRIEDVDSVEQTNYPLTLVAGLAERLVLRLVYDTDRVAPAAAARMLAHLEAILAGFAADPQRRLVATPILSAAERQQLLVDWNDTARPFPEDQTAHQLFEAWAARSPDAIATIFESQRLSYAELNRRANQLAHHLRRHGVGPERLVAICMERSPEQLVAILGVLKAGGAYLPLDPSYPHERLRLMIADAGVELLVAHAPVAELVGALLDSLTPSPFRGGGRGEGSAAHHLHLIDLTRDAQAIAAEPESNPDPGSGPRNLAYVIYTSGSTGRPKGTLIEHRGLVNLISAYAASLEIGPGDRGLQFFAFGFDGSVLDIFAPLTSGAAVCQIPRRLTMPGAELATYMREHSVSIAMLPPSVLAALPADNLPALRALLSGGEACTPDLVARWAPGRRFFNAYGPTEATVAVSWHQVDAVPAGASVPLGGPVANTRFYLLDHWGQPVPVGVPGELHIGGASLARGYLNRPELTAERFVDFRLQIADLRLSESEQSTIKNLQSKIYKTGDLMRWRDDGTLEFLGRIDQQVKLRGFRIELGEIEAALCALPALRDAVVTLREDSPGDRRLVAYVVPAQGDPAAFSPAQARTALASSLPTYMVPAAFVALAALPLTPNGKVDRRALPAPDLAPAAPRTIVPPRDVIERALLEIWEEVLDVRPLGIDDDFFEHGGHSLLVVRAAALIEGRLGRRLPLLSMFQQRTVAELAPALRATAAAGQAAQALVPIQPAGERPPIFFIHPSGGSVHWYLDLAQQLGRDQPFYGLQARGVDGDAPLHTQVEEMATYYLAAIRSVQPEGPYYLGSWSLGVVLVFELAQQLYAQGQEVALLAILDQGPTAPGDEPTDDAAYLIEVFGDHVPLRLDDLRPLSYADQIAHVLREGQRIRWIHRDVTLGQFQHFVNLLRTHKQAWHHYTPGPYPGRVTLFRAIEGAAPAPERHRLPGGAALARLAAAIPRPRRARVAPSAPADGNTMGWEQLARAGVEAYDVPGDHISMLSEPHVRVLADRLRACIDAATVRTEQELA